MGLPCVCVWLPVEMVSSLGGGGGGEQPATALCHSRHLVSSHLASYCM